jgi:hypothetical protein
VADEIEALDTEPLLLVQTAPPDGTLTPAGPITINIRGLASSGAKVNINGKALPPQNISAKGCFIDVRLLEPKQPELVITAELNGKTRLARRAFRIVE